MASGHYLPPRSGDLGIEDDREPASFIDEVRNGFIVPFGKWRGMSVYT